MSLRDDLVGVALKWERRFGVAPQITSAIGENDAALLVGMKEEEYSAAMQGQTAVQKGFDFMFKGLRYQVKAGRSSGKPGSKVTRVSKASNLEFDYLLWLLYNPLFELQEAWQLDVDYYRREILSIVSICARV